MALWLSHLITIGSLWLCSDCFLRSLAGYNVFRLRGGCGHAALTAAAPCYRSSVEKKYASGRRLPGVVAAHVVGIGISDRKFFGRSSVADAVAGGPTDVGDDVTDHLDV
ncbi:hypothetical protein OUZ56_025476 [Daphnia magna]|uniref:Secreted protein n=1 Tax=Daphnia magna TaxID=35525 RepID=A0ABQ9ZK03_9CRUS|nr:hypothetical protein OUZ56_025476 [Daphnia magna]